MDNLVDKLDLSMEFASRLDIDSERFGLPTNSIIIAASVREFCGVLLGMDPELRRMLLESDPRIWAAICGWDAAWGHEGSEANPWSPDTAGQIEQAFSRSTLLQAIAGQFDQSLYVRFNNLPAAERIIRLHSDAFPVAATHNTAAWLRDTHAWLAGQHGLLMGLLSGYPSSAVRDHEFVQDLTARDTHLNGYSEGREWTLYTLWQQFGHGEVTPEKLLEAMYTVVNTEEERLHIRQIVEFQCQIRRPGYLPEGFDPQMNLYSQPDVEFMQSRLYLESMTTEWAKSVFAEIGV